MTFSFLLLPTIEKTNLIFGNRKCGFLIICDLIEQAAGDAAWPVSRSTVPVLGVILSEILPLLPESWKPVSCVGDIMRDTRKANEFMCNLSVEHSLQVSTLHLSSESMTKTMLHKFYIANRRESIVVLILKYLGQPRWLSGLGLPSAQGVILETRD